MTMSGNSLQSGEEGTDNYAPDKVWEWAAAFVETEPKVGDAPTEQRRLICERCGDSGVQPAGCWTGKAYDSIAGRCELCDGEGKLGIMETGIEK